MTSDPRICAVESGPMRRAACRPPACAGPAADVQPARPLGGAVLCPPLGLPWCRGTCWLNPHPDLMCDAESALSNSLPRSPGTVYSALSPFPLLPCPHAFVVHLLFGLDVPLLSVSAGLRGHKWSRRPLIRSRSKDRELCGPP